MRARVQAPLGVVLKVVLIGVVLLVSCGGPGTPTPARTPAVTGAPPTADPGTTGPRAGDVRVNATDGAAYLYVPAGDFLMGSTDADPQAVFHEKPQHTVYLDGFWIARTETTNAQYTLCVQAGTCQPSKYANLEHYDAPDQPVVGMTWTDAVAYCRWAGGRLPTEAEWEKAARGTDGRIYTWGNVFDATRLNFCDKRCTIEWHDLTVDDGYADSAPVGSYPAGASVYGALDMLGNAWEWTSSLYRPYPYRADDGREDPAAEGVRVVRGGSYFNFASYARTAFHYGYAPTVVYPNFGFRCAASP
jgi:formylglycine-generating enzyme required for sulfatase activity